MTVRQWPDLATSSDVSESADVCIVGSGCGAASLASRLAEAGRSVVIL